MSDARWRPVRAGIRNVWEYDDQVFEFADGRLVLRGPNGSGKSNALAVLVPFLLDGVMSSGRMDSMAGGRSMKTLLLCLADDERGNRFRHEQRTGYAWLEFERDGHYTTIGCGARASAQRDADAWFFVTPRRPGIDLELAPGAVPLSRGGLADVLGAAAVHDSAESYRAAVDRALFGLGPARYRNLVELLLVLRRPHLAGKLDLERLSSALSDGLAALDDGLVADVAASFEDLEAVQQDLRRLREADRTVQAFLPVYRRYLTAVARSRAEEATEATRALRAARRRVADAERAVAAAESEVERVERDRLACRQQQEVAEQRQRAVLESPAYLEATSLAEVEARLADGERGLDEADQRLGKAGAEVAAATAELAEADEGVRAAETAVELAFVGAAEAADAAGVAWTIDRREVGATDLGQVVRGLGSSRREDVAALRAALAEWETARARARATTTAAEAAADDSHRAAERRRVAASALDGARAALADALGDWVAASAVPGLAALVDMAGEVGEPGAPSLVDTVTDVLRPRREELTTLAVRAEDLTASLAGEHDELVAQRRRIADDPVPAPDRAPFRPADRTGRRGGPLYACCDFAEDVPAGDRAGLEASLEAAGLLDAWVGERSDELDAWLRPLPPAPAPTLADVLVPTPPVGSGLTAEAIRDVLASISLADAGVAVLADGRFDLGPLTGRFAKAEAEFIGATAREQRRRRLLAELDDRIAAVAERLAAVDRQQTEIAAEQQRLHRVAASLPSPADVLSARDGLVSAVAAAKAIEEAAARAAAVAREAQRAANERLDHLRAVGAERRLPTTSAGLDETDRLVHSYERQAGELVHAASRLGERRAGRERVAGRATRAEEALTLCRQERDARHMRVSGLRARVEQLRRQLGPDAEAPLRELASIEDELRRLRDEADRLSREASAASEARGRALQEQELARGAVAGHESAAVEATARLDVLRRNDVWAVVGGQPNPPADGGELATAVLAATSDVAVPADDNALQRAYRQLLDELGRGYDPGLSWVDRVAIVEVTSDAGTFSVLWLAEELANQVSRQQELLSERDREIFERHLLTRVSEALRELLNDADELVDRINRSLADRPTASGKSVQLRWELEAADPAVRSALGLLRRAPELLGPDERDQLRRFFSTAIAQRRAEDAASGYAEILRRVLDYRSWHTFVPYVRSAGGGVQKLTRTLYRSLSGGEQAVVLHLPLFAAAAAHYDAADGTAPRLIALDEAFAGIDEGMRGQLMGLLVGFDLDVLLTGHELWGAYEEVPALMVYDLLRQPPLEGVSAYAVRWDGAAMAEA